MRLQDVDRISLEPFGVAENRRFYLADPEGRMLNAVRHGALLAVVPAYDPRGERLTLAFPDGTSVEGDAATVGEPVRSSFYGRPVEGRAVEGPWEDALSSYLGVSARLVRTDRPGEGIDSHAASMFSAASAEELDRRAGRDGSPLDRRRWRMLMEVAGCEPHEEDSWVGRQVRVDRAVVQVVRTDPRCVITTRHPDTGGKEFDTLRALATYRRADAQGDLPFGVYADVSEPGEVAVGGSVEPL
jgi:uncharacterized protein YcbX